MKGFAFRLVMGKCSSQPAPTGSYWWWAMEGALLLYHLSFSESEHDRQRYHLHPHFSDSTTELPSRASARQYLPHHLSGPRHGKRRVGKATRRKLGSEVTPRCFSTGRKSDGRGFSRLMFFVVWVIDISHDFSCADFP